MACQLEDKVFVQCKAGPKAKVMLHYSMESQGVMGEEKTEPVKERYQGIYNREFILFYGEKLHYHFVVERKGETLETREEILTVDKAETRGTSKYQMLNAMLLLKEQGKARELEQMTEEYRRKEQQVASLFPLLD